MESESSPPLGQRGGSTMQCRAAVQCSAAMQASAVRVPYSAVCHVPVAVTTQVHTGTDQSHHCFNQQRVPLELVQGLTRLCNQFGHKQEVGIAMSVKEELCLTANLWGH